MTRLIEGQIEDMNEKKLIGLLQQAIEEHLTERELDLYADGLGSDFMKARVRAHINTCYMCRIEVETLEEYRYGIWGEELARARNLQNTSEPALSGFVRDFKEKVSVFLGSILPSSLLVPIRAAAIGDWSDEIELANGGAWKYRELDDGELEYRIRLTRVDDVSPVVRLEDDQGWFKEVELEKGPISWYGSLILTVEERNRLAQAEEITWRTYIDGSSTETDAPGIKTER